MLTMQAFLNMFRNTKVDWKRDCSKLVLVGMQKLQKAENENSAECSLKCKIRRVINAINQDKMHG